MTGPERKQLAIINGDVVGYSRLMAADDAATVQRLSELRDLISIVVVANHGRVIDFTGDNFMAEFGLAAHALSAAAEIQNQISSDNELPGKTPMQFRIGVHAGDVFVEGDRIYGNTVNIAARLEGLAEPGGICASHAAYESAAGTLDVEFEELGAQDLKNIPDPVAVLRVAPAALSRARAPVDGRGPATIPTVAVLPFEDPSGNVDEQSLLEAMTVEIIAGLSCDRRFAVIAYNSVARFRGQRPDTNTLGRVLHARYLVDGNVRRLGKQLRFTVSLVDVETSSEIWSKRRTTELGAIFAAFDDVVGSLVTQLGSHLQLAECARFARNPPTSVEPWSLAIRASATFFLNPTVSLDESLAAAARAVELDPAYAYGWAVWGFLTAFKFPLGLSTDHQADIDESLRLTERGMALDARDPWILAAKAVALQYGGRAEESLPYLERSLRLNPSDVLAHCYYGRGLMFSGRPAAALAHFERFRRLNPNDPGAHMAGMYHALALLFLERWDECDTIAREAVAASGGRNPWVWLTLAIAEHARGHEDAAANALAELHKVAPHWTPAFAKGFLYECQADKSLLTTTNLTLDAIWPESQAWTSKVATREP